MMESLQAMLAPCEIVFDVKDCMLCLVYCFLVLRHRLSVISVAEQCPARPSVVWTYC